MLQQVGRALCRLARGRQKSLGIGAVFLPELAGVLFGKAPPPLRAQEQVERRRGLWM